MKTRQTKITQIIFRLGLVFFASFPVFGKYSGGTGEPNDPYQIATAEDLMLLGETPDDYDKHFILTADIDLDPNLPGRKVFDRAVIAPDVNDTESLFQGTSFSGVFDGNGHTIFHLTISDESYLGLFGHLDFGAMIFNLCLEEVDVNGNGGHVGGLVGSNDGHIALCYSAGTVLGDNDVGGLVGNNFGSIATSHSTGTVAGSGGIGGLVGMNRGSITTSYSTSSVTGYASSGGLAGWSDGIVIQCYSTGTASSVYNVGGLIGISNGEIITSYSTSMVSGGEEVGGLVGFAGEDSRIDTSHSTGSASGNHNVGGLVGANTGSITTSYSTGMVTGIEDIGGLVGNDSNPRHVSRTTGSTIASFWDMETSDQKASAGGTGLSTAEMQTASTFLEAGWDFEDETANGPNDVWKIVEAQTYPLLSWQKYGGGAGEPNDPYLIYTTEHLNKLGAEPNDYTKHFKLMADIDLSGYVYDRAVISPDVNDEQVGFQGTLFSGIFNGNNYMISDLTITGDGYLGLFGQLDSRARVSNLGLKEANINGTGCFVGALVGRIGSSEGKGAILANCNSTGIVTGEYRVGGLVGDNNFGCITSSYSNCKVEGEIDVGGLVGSHGGSDAKAGGILVNCDSTGMVDGEVSVGGLVGQNGGFIIGSCSTGAVTGSSAVGGLVGSYVFGWITNSYCSGGVKGNELVGGLVGHNNYGSINMCYSSSEVIGTEYVGGLVGSNDYSNITASFWDIEASGMRAMCGNQSGVGCDDKWGRTTAQMQDINTYISAGWDFVDEMLNGTCDYWQISPDDYPELHRHADKEPVIQQGTGTIEDPFLIQDITNLSTVWLDPSAHYCLEASLDLSGSIWSMAVVPWFGGTLDGNGHVISNLRIQGSEYLGLFGQLGIGTEIYDLGLENIDVNGTGAYIGSLSGINVGANISRCYSDGIIAGGGTVGGLAGKNDKGSIAECFSAAIVNGIGLVGGLVGNNGDGIVTSYSIGPVKGVTGVGSLVGRNLSRGSIAMSYGAGKVVGNQETGGLVGFNDGIITSSFWDIDNSGQNTSTGGIGKTTTEMQTASTFLEMEWDFADEIENGTDDTWWIFEGQDYPRLWWELISEN